MWIRFEFDEAYEKAVKYNAGAEAEPNESNRTIPMSPWHDYIRQFSTDLGRSPTTNTPRIVKDWCQG